MLMETKEDKFIVRRKRAPDRMMVFELAPDGTKQINIRNGPTDIFIAVPEVLPDGECWLRVGDEALRFWQVSKKALEGLFFGA